MAIVIPQEDPQTVNPPRAQVLGDETTFGGGQGLEAENAQTQQIAQHTNEIATFEKIRADQTAVQGVTAKSSELYDKLANDPKDGLPAYKGINAMDGHDKIMAEWQKNTNELVKGLQPDQQGAAIKMILEQGHALDQHAMAYAHDQRDQYDANTFQASIKNNTVNASKSYGNPDTVAMFQKQNDLIASARAKRLGLDSDQTEDFMRNVHSQFYESVLSQMVNDPKFQGTAEQYFTDHKSEMDIDSQERVQKWLGDGSIKSQSNQMAAELLQAHPKSESDALAAVDKKTDDPDVRAQARQIISSEFKQNRDAKTNDQAQVAENVLDRVAKSGETDPVRIAQMISTTEKNGMTGAQYNSIIRSQDVRESSPSMLMDYHQAVADGSIAKMSRADLQTEFLSKASPQDQHAIIKVWSEGQKDVKNLAPTQTYNEIVKAAAVSAKIVPASGTWEQEDKDKYKLFNDEITKRMEATERATGKKLSPANQIDLANQVVIDHTFNQKGMLWGSTNVYEPYTKEFSSTLLRQYPSANEDQISQAYSMVQRGLKAKDIDDYMKGK